MSGIKTQYGMDVIWATEGQVIMRPKIQGPAKPGVIYSHGSGELCYGFFSKPRAAIYMALVEAGYTVVSCDNAGMETWGNDQAMLRMAQAFNYLRSQPGVLDEPMVMIGQSMGALNSLVYAHTYPLNTRCVIGLIPVIDVTDIHSNNRGGLAATINGCYAGGWSELVYGADKNPATMAAAGQLDDMPIQLWYGASDTLCLPTLAADFVTNSGCEGHSIAGGHAESTMNETAIPPAALIEFIEAAG